MDDTLRPARQLLLADRRARGLDARDDTVRLLPANEVAGEIFMATRNQVVTAGQGQAIDLHIPAVKIVMDLYGVRDQRAVLDRVRWLWHEIEHQRGE